MAVAAKEWPLVKARQNDDEEGRDLNTEEEEEEDDDKQDSRHQEQQLQHNKKKDNNVQVDDTSTIHHDDTGKKSKKRRPNCNRNEITSTTPSLKDLLVGNDVSFTHSHKYNSNDNTTSNCIATSLQNYDNIKNNITEDINAENTTNKSVQHYQKKSKYFHTPKKSCGGGVSSQLSSGKHNSSNPDPNSSTPSYETTIARHKKQLEINKVKGIPTNKIPLPPKGGILSIDIGIVANTVDLNGYTGETQYEKALLESSALMLRRNQGKPLPASVDATLYQCKPENVNTNAEIEAMDLSKRGVYRVGGRRKNFYGEGSRKGKDYARIQAEKAAALEVEASQCAGYQTRKKEEPSLSYPAYLKEEKERLQAEKAAALEIEKLQHHWRKANEKIEAKKNRDTEREAENVRAAEEKALLTWLQQQQQQLVQQQLLLNQEEQRLNLRIRQYQPLIV